ncbi:MAG TPA: hypothetical protein PKH06_02895 [Candidatus Dojkabacteria bacterium]|nr:hypothetical protein [Candidatus Dojkabacteria bacterium]
MKRVKDILPSILYLLIFLSILGLIAVLVINSSNVQESNIYKKIIGEKVSQTYDLEKGINFIGVDFNSKYTVSRIINENPDISLIGDYDNNDWKNIVRSGSKRATKGNNFKLKQYKGYIVIAKKDTTLELVGRKYNREMKFKFDKGLNLVSASNYSNSLELIKDFKDKEIAVLGVSSWENTIDRFVDNVVKDNVQYGEDRKISKQSGVFINIE